MKDLLKHGKDFVQIALLIVIIVLLLGKDSTVDPSMLLTGGFMATLSTLITSTVDSSLTELPTAIDIKPDTVYIRGEVQYKTDTLNTETNTTLFVDRFVSAKADTIWARVGLATNGIDTIPVTFDDSLILGCEASGNFSISSNPSIISFDSKMLTVTITQALEWYEYTAVVILAVATYWLGTNN